MSGKKMLRIRLGFGVCSRPERQLGVNLDEEIQQINEIRGKDVYDGDSVLTDIDGVMVGVTEWEKGVWRRGLAGTKLDIEAGTGIVGGGGHGCTKRLAFSLSVVPRPPLGPVRARTPDLI